MATILVLYYSRGGSTAELARQVCRGIDGVPGATSMLRTVPPVSTGFDSAPPSVPTQGPPYATAEEFASCDGLLLGSPTRFGNMAAPLKFFLDGTSAAWASGALVGKPAAVFTSTSTPHGGHESTLLSMMLPLFHHGMLLVGLPFTEAELSRTPGGGSPYGAGAVVHGSGSAHHDEERHLARRLGERVATIAIALGRGRPG